MSKFPQNIICSARTPLGIFVVACLISSNQIETHQADREFGASQISSHSNFILEDNGHSQQGSESCHLREMELCLVGGGSFLQNANGIPVNKIEIERQCELFQESSECFVNYGQRCSMNRQFTFMSLFTGSLFDMERDFCDPNSELRKNYTRQASCLKTFQKRHQNTCLTQFQVAFEPVHKIRWQDRLPLVCCNFKRLKLCIGPKVEQECGEEALDLVEAMVQKALGDRLWVMCRNYDSESEQCLSLLPDPNAQPHCK